MNKTITCSFTLDRELYDKYKSIVVSNHENVKGNLIKYMKNVIEYKTPNADTIEALEEVRKLKNNPNKKTYDSFGEFLKEIESEE